jgi:putative chitinase
MKGARTSATRFEATGASSPGAGRSRSPAAPTSPASTSGASPKGLDPPDFIKTPDLINTDPWEGLSAIWYWHVGNPTGKSLNVFADKNDIEMITRRINGGLNGYDDRLHRYTRASLVLAGYAPTAIKPFQVNAQKAGFLPKGKDQLDGIDGPKTRAAIHLTLAKGEALARRARHPESRRQGARTRYRRRGDRRRYLEHWSRWCAPDAAGIP